MIRILRMIFCRHRWEQRAWLGKESGYLCMKCGRIQYREGPGGQPPEGVSFSPETEVKQS